MSEFVLWKILKNFIIYIIWSQTHLCWCYHILIIIHSDFHKVFVIPGNPQGILNGNLQLINGSRLFSFHYLWLVFSYCYFIHASLKSAMWKVVYLLLERISYFHYFKETWLIGFGSIFCVHCVKTSLLIVLESISSLHCFKGTLLIDLESIYCLYCLKETMFC